MIASLGGSLKVLHGCRSRVGVWRLNRRRDFDLRGQPRDHLSAERATGRYGAFGRSESAEQVPKARSAWRLRLNTARRWSRPVACTAAASRSRCGSTKPSGRPSGDPEAAWTDPVLVGRRHRAGRDHLLPLRPAQAGPPDRAAGPGHTREPAPHLGCALHSPTFVTVARATLGSWRPIISSVPWWRTPSATSSVI